jgi:uncharacterized protein YfaP (DUF2135 family)
MNHRFYSVAFLACAMPLGAFAGITLDTPRAGWRTGSDEGAHFMQEVNYPASAVNSAPDQGDSARIRGQISATDKAPSGAPARLVVNGLSMPLKVQEGGGFDRPFVFPAGSNNVEVRSPDGQQVRRVQFYNNGSALDVDVTGGFGPEMIASPTPLKGEYLVYVNYYGGGHGVEGDPAQALTTAQVTLISGEGSSSEKQESFLIPMRAPGELTLVKRFSYP